MSPKQWKWLESVAAHIPGLFRGVESGSEKTTHVIGERIINGRTVRLSLVAQVVDPGTNPLNSHASANCPSTGVVVPDGMVMPAPKRRSAKRSKYW